VPLPRQCDSVLSARRLCRDGAVVPRTHGTVLQADNATVWSAEVPQGSDVLAVCSRAASTRVTDPAVERFSTTGKLIRERATEGWRVSTLTMKES